MTKERPGMPYAQSPIAIYLTKQIDALRGIKSQREIAAEMGYEKPNIISMFKRGEMKVPLERVPALAKAVYVDPAVLFRMAMEQYWPGNNEAIGAIFGTIVTKNEVEILTIIRESTDGKDPEVTPELSKLLRCVFKEALI